MNGMAKRKNHYSNNRNFGGRNQGRHKKKGMHHGSGDDNVVHPRQRRHLQTQKDRYQGLARDAQAGGDRVLAEYYYQYVEHYTRMIGLIPDPQQNNQPKTEANDADDATTTEATNEAPAEGDAEQAPAKKQLRKRAQPLTEKADDAEGDEPAAPSGNYDSGPSSYYAQSSKSGASKESSKEQSDSEEE